MVVGVEMVGVGGVFFGDDEWKTEVRTKYLQPTPKYVGTEPQQCSFQAQHPKIYFVLSKEDHRPAT